MKNLDIVRSLIFLLFFAAATPGLAQVDNDSIAHMKKLLLENTYNSKTNGCTVEWECVDEALTGKCIDYHNDQWFTFNSEENSTLYVNIMNQNCKDLYGVQVVVLKGEPCNTSSYNILRCVSLATQDDIYVSLDSLEHNTDYIVNIDGYLHDFCHFEIQISKYAKGFPSGRSSQMNVSGKAIRNQEEVIIKWSLPDSLKSVIKEFQVYRRIHPAFKYKLMDVFPVNLNAYGEISGTFAFYDTLKTKAIHYYQLFAVDNTNKLHLIDTYDFKLSFNPDFKCYKKEIRVPLTNIRKKSSYTLVIYEYYSKKLIFYNSFKKSLEHHRVYTRRFIENNVEKVIVNIIDGKSNRENKYVYDLKLDDCK